MNCLCRFLNLWEWMCHLYPGLSSLMRKIPSSSMKICKITISSVGKSSLFLRRVAQQQARSTHYRPLNVDQVTLALIDKSVAEFAQDTYEEQVFVQDARRGIICPHCQASIKSSEINRFAIECSRCGGYEAKERAILRTICEIGLLHYDQALNSTMVCEFIGVEGLERSARRKLLGFFK